MPKLTESKLTFADMRLIAVIANNGVLRAALIRGDVELAKKMLRLEDGEVVDFSDAELSRMESIPGTWWEPVDGDHRKLRRRCTE